MYRNLLIAFGLLIGSTASAADHLDAPSLSGNGQVDVNDLYAFQSPSNPENSVLILTVNPFAGALSPIDFGTSVDYEFNIDNTGDALADLTFLATFTGSGTGQTINLTSGSETLASGIVGTSLPIAGGGMVQAGVFDDPFFFDLAGFNDGFNFTGEDTLAGANVSAIVLEVPSTSLGGPNIGVWARTVQAGSQIDRIGRPAINTALLSGDERKEAFNIATPDMDTANFGADVTAAITSLSNAENAESLTAVLLPDVLTFDTSSAAGFLNGRQLADDVIDAELNLLSAGAVSGDGVDANDVPFSTAFPYLAPQNVPEPSASLLLACSGLLVVSGLRRRRRK